MAIDSRDRGEPSLLWEGAGEYGEGGMGSCEELCATGRRERCSRAGDRDVLRRFRA